ncbi:hypothetical protein SAMN05421788_107319 [Filimonas lacunae]|uniref:Uncharacterized protein n=1 Tax=Filimonas lacunae TaxID=477680 RepID=A0A173MGN5_9BACT|nr:hypothetical protein [Filimonas lacunae]BAV06659.1 hypothetical protein FLA_2678 [Filimonas lacunae]SIT27791.1 hypothetical protein SAMN05421788_107319 [Filimonas lacunae]
MFDNTKISSRHWMNVGKRQNVVVKREYSLIGYSGKPQLIQTCIYGTKMPALTQSPSYLSHIPLTTAKTIRYF